MLGIGLLRFANVTRDGILKLSNKSFYEGACCVFDLHFDYAGNLLRMSARFVMIIYIRTF